MNPGRDLRMVSRHHSYPFGVMTSRCCCDMNFFSSLFPLVSTTFSLSQPPFSSHDFTCSRSSFFFKAKFVDVVTWNCWKLSFLSQLKFPVVTSILLQADFFLFLLKFDFLLYFPANWNLCQLSLLCKQFNIILIINSEKWIKNLMSFWTHQIPPNLKFCLSLRKEEKELFVLKQISLETF